MLVYLIKQTLSFNIPMCILEYKNDRDVDINTACDMRKNTKKPSV